MSIQESIIKDIERDGKYLVLNEVKEGANSFSFIAKDVHLDITVFLKVMYYAPNDLSVLNEPRSLIKVTEDPNSLPYLVRVYDVSKLNTEYIYISMELVEGCSLWNYLTNRTIKLMDAIELAKHLVTGLSYLHNVGFVHRDLKPGNIFLYNNGDRLQAKLGDFGSVKKIENRSAFVTASQNSALYMPPEGWNIPCKYGIPSDIYQIGLVVWECLNGSLPRGNHHYWDNIARKEMKKAQDNFQLDSYTQCQIENRSLDRLVRAGKIIKMNDRRPYIPKPILKIINKATHPNVSLRYQSCFSLLTDLAAKNYPNWYFQDDVYYAEKWNGYDYKIEKVITKSILCGYQTYRRRIGENKYRRFGALSAQIQGCFKI